MNTEKKRRLTGLKPTGRLHIGNYFGALKPFIDSYQEYDSYIMVADYHALTTQRDPEVLHADIIEITKAYLAAGLDPEKATVFRQSDNQDHMELAWVLNCMVTVPFLELAHAYKDKIAKGQEANAGLFTYPMLMASDIVLYDTDIVPVGEDQRQHVEYAREAVGKFNRSFASNKPVEGAYGGNEIVPILKEPTEQIQKSVGVVPGTDGQKMSKSYGNTIPLFGTPEEIQKAVMSIVTDSTGERPEHVYAIHRLLKTAEELEPIYEEHKGRYGDLKKILIADLEAFIAPMREKRAAISAEEVKAILADGVTRAKAVSSKTLARVREAIGIAL